MAIVRKQKIKRNIYEYTVFFERNELHGYTATVPALPGLVTEGRTLEEARIMAKDAIECYVAGLIKAKEQVPKEDESAQMRVSVAV